MKKAELKEQQEAIYGIFLEFDRICTKYGIRYSMEGGTLLGAVKYRDFVPRGLRPLYKLKVYELEFPLMHPQYVISDLAYNRAVDNLWGATN